MIPPLRIAVADDETDMRDYFRKILSRLGHQVVSVAESGRELLEQCRPVRPDLVITDFRMPELDGLAAAAALQSDWPVPVILVSACFNPASVSCAEMEHVMGHIVKPIRQTDLEPAIASALRRFRQTHFSRRERETSPEKHAV